jgi:hypothetical protein
MTAGSDRQFDLSLRILTVLVGVALLGCVGFFGYRWAAPVKPDPASVRLVSAGAPAAATAPIGTQAAPAPQLLYGPGVIFRCEQRGRVTYAEQPCAAGTAARIAAR